MDLLAVLQHLRASRCPEDVFGLLKGSTDEMLNAAHEIYRQLAKATHPDRHAGAEASEAFRLLGQRWLEAQDRIRRGVYGDKRQVVFTLTTKTRTYAANVLCAHGDFADVYWANDREVLLKVVREGRDNDLMDNEAKIIKVLRSDPKGVRMHSRIPELTDAVVHGGRKINVFTAYPERLYSLAEIIATYPQGIDPRDMVWMWKRALAVLGYVHAMGYVHGAVLPPHLLYDLRNHGVVLADWTASCMHGKAVRVLSTPYEADYPPEILRKQPVGPTADLYMLAKAMARALGPDGLAKTSPRPLANLLRGCMTEAPQHRLDNSWWLHQEIDGLLTSLFGPRRFRQFTMPT